MRMLIERPDGTQILSRPGTYPAIKTIRATECVNSGTEIIMGAVCSNSIEITFIAPDGVGVGISAGDLITVYNENDDGTIHSMVGRFVCERPVYTSDHTIKIVGYDETIKLDKDLTMWLASLTGWPYELEQFIRLVLAECGLGLVTAVPNDSYPVNRFTAQSATGRQLLQWALELTGRFFRINEKGQGELVWYKDTAKTVTPSGEMFYYMNGLNFEDYQVQPVEAVQIKLADSNAGYLFPEVPAGTNAYIIQNNPIATAQIDGETSGYLDALKSVLEQVQYTPCRLAVPVSHDIHAGDIINVITKSGHAIKMYVMTATRVNNKVSLECTGSPRRDSTTAYYSQPASVVAANAAQRAVNGMAPAQVLNLLTNNGQYQGIYMLDGQIYINSTYIRAGSISADKITLDGDFSVYSGDTLGGHVGYMSGSDGETVTDGIGVRSADGASYVIATDAGIRMQSGTFRSYIVKGKRFVIEGDLWCKGNMQLKSLTPYADGDMEWRYIDSIGATVLVKTGA